MNRKVLIAIIICGMAMLLYYPFTKKMKEGFVSEKQADIKDETEQQNPISSLLHEFKGQLSLTPFNFSIPPKYKDYSTKELLWNDEVVSEILFEKASVLAGLIIRALENSKFTNKVMITIDMNCLSKLGINKEEIKDFSRYNKNEYILSFYDFARAVGWINERNKTSIEQIRKVINQANIDEKALGFTERTYLGIIETLISNITVESESLWPFETTKKIEVSSGETFEIPAIGGNPAALTAINQEVLRKYFMPKLNNNYLGTLYTSGYIATVIFTSFNIKKPEKALIYDLATGGPLHFCPGENFSSLLNLFANPTSSSKFKFEFKPPILDTGTEQGSPIRRLLSSEKNSP